MRSRVGIEALEPRAYLALATAIDSVIFGNTTSETAHALVATSSQVIAGGLSQSARQLLPFATPEVNGGTLTFTLAVDPVQRNYFTVKLWGSDDTDMGKGRLYLYVPIGGVNYQVGYRHEGDYAPLSVTASKPPLPGRFFYSTTLLPLSITQGKTLLTLKIQSAGELYGLGSGGPPSGNYQMVMDTPSRGVYRAYTHTQALLDVSGETQGTAPTTTTRPAVSEASVIGPTGTFTTGLKNWVTGKLSAAITAFTATDVSMLARSYSVSQITTGYQVAAVVTKVIDVLDGFATDYYTNPSTSLSTSNYGAAGGNEVWGGRFGELGWAISLLAGVSSFQSALDVAVGYGAAGGSKTRRQAWGDMLAASRDYGRFNRDSRYLTNQSLIADEHIYKANRGLLALSDSRAFTEANAQRYLKESIGLLPWLGSDLPAGGSTLKYGSNYYQVTPDGLTREWGYAGAYSEMHNYAAHFYKWTGNTAFRDQAVKIAKALAYMRRPAIETSGTSSYRSSERVGLLAWRGVREADGYFTNDIDYAGGIGFAEGMAVAGETLDPTLIGYAKQMLADNQYLAHLTDDSRYYSSLTFDSRFVMEAFDDYNAVKNAADSGARLPMTSGQPDFAWADETDGIVVIKRGADRLWAEPFWQAKAGTGINGIGRFYYSTGSYEQYGVMETTPTYTSIGSYFIRPNNVDMPEQTLFAPPDAPTQAYANEQLPIAAAPGDADDDTPFRGRADFYAFRLGNYLIGLNNTAASSYTLKTPSDFTSATDLMSGAAKSGTVTVSPFSTVALYLTSGVDASPVPNAPLFVKAVGSPTQVQLNWSASSGASTYTVKRAAGSGVFVTIASGLTSTAYTDSTVTRGVAYRYVVSASNANGESYDSSIVSTSAGLPAAWNSIDFGTPTPAGSASLSNGTWTVLGGSGDLGGTSDTAHFAYVSLNGDGAIVARVVNATYTNGADKVGVMIRETLAANAKNASLQLRDDADTVNFNYRATAGASTTGGASITPVGAPYWLRLTRSGSTFTADVSPDGMTWTNVGSTNLVMTSSVYAGLFVTSRYAQQLNATQFDNVSVTPNAAPTIATPAAVSASPVTTTSTTLSVLGADDGGESSLTYWWDAASTPAGVAGPALGNVNGTNSAKSLPVMFAGPGSYAFNVTVRDARGLTVTSTVTVNVVRAVASVSVTPTGLMIAPGATQSFAALALDQFGDTFAMSPTNFMWTSSLGSVSGTGLLTAPLAAGPVTVHASVGGKMGSASVTVGLVSTSSRFIYDASVQRVELDFNGNLLPFANSVVQLVNTTTGITIATGTVSVSTSGATATIAMSGHPAGELPDGDYTLTLDAGIVFSSGGAALMSPVSTTFFALAGDFNRDRAVNFADLLALASSYGSTSKTYAQGNADRDAAGVVNFNDLLVLAEHYGHGLAAAFATSVTDASASAAPASFSAKPISRVAEDVL
ncbi:MAG: hypothetical protein QM770_21215 [Tepidisphaeraceae bacterium]